MVKVGSNHDSYDFIYKNFQWVNDFIYKKSVGKILKINLYLWNIKSFYYYSKIY